MLLNAQVYDLKADGQVIGTLLVDNINVPHPVRLSLGVLNPVILVSGLMLLLTLVIGFLLMRRMVNPLSEVIAAAESVSAGHLNTRIKIRKSQDDMGTLVQHFNHMTETLERNDNERKALLADVAHELRTPLSVLRGRLEGILDGVYPPNEANIAQALEETYMLERLVEDLRLLTMAESRQLHFEIEETNLVELLRKSITLFAPQAKAKMNEIELQSDQEIILASVDPQRIEQVIANLVGNSLRYAPANSKILLTIEKNDADVTLKVADSGPGVPEAEIPYIFDRFWRGEKSRARVSGGAGLGLAICKQLVEAQGGTISAQNRAQGGLEVTIHLPTNNSLL
jgi:signal transduction histidine kinase